MKFQILFLFFLLFLSACVIVEPSSRSKVYIERSFEEPQTFVQDTSRPSVNLGVPAKDYLEMVDNSQLVLHTLQMDSIIYNPSSNQIVLTRVCTEIYDYFDKLIKKDVWYMIAPIAPDGEKHLKRNIYTEPTQSKIPKHYKIEICGAEHSTENHS